MVVRAVITLVSCAAMSSAAGCSSDDPPSGGRDEPITARALAVVMDDHTGTPSEAGEETDMEETGPHLVAAARMSHRGDGPGSLSMGVGRDLDLPADCADVLEMFGLATCAAVDSGLLYWEVESPGEDPGVVYLQVAKGRTDVLFFYSGPSITGDPRDVDMPVSVTDMQSIAADPRVDVTTSEETVEAGEAIDYWVDP